MGCPDGPDGGMAIGGYGGIDPLPLLLLLVLALTVPSGLVEGQASMVGGGGRIMNGSGWG